MGRTTKPLSATQVEAAKPKEREYNLSDGQGLQLRIRPNGTKSWLFNYSHPINKKRSNLSLGRYPATSLATARSLRLEQQELLANGIDPKTHREELIESAKLKSTFTFESVSKEWIKLHSSKVNDNTIEDIKKSFDKNVYPFIGKLSVGDISFRLLKHEVVGKIIERQSLEIARKVARRINQVLSFAVLNEYVEHNVASDLSKLIPSSQQRNLPALKPEELEDLLKAAHWSRMTFQTRCLFEWQLHTITRPGEAAQTEWSEIDFAQSLWVIPSSKMKAKREHTIPLTPVTLKILEMMKPLSSHRRYVFPSAKVPNSHMNKESINRAIVRMGFKGRTVAHGLRSLASTTLNEQGFDPDVIEAALAHKDPNKVRAAYNRATYLEKRKVMMSWWSEHISKYSNYSVTTLEDTYKS